MCKAGVEQKTAERVKAWLNYALGDGQAVAKTLQYAALPSAIRSSAQGKVESLTCNGQPLQAAS